MKKCILTASALLALSGIVFAEEASISFENKISSDIVSISKDETSFAGIEEQVTAEIEMEKVNAGVSLIADLDKIEDYVGITGYDFDKAYVEFKPIDLLSIEFNKKIFTDGSYLPIIDDNVGNGNISSEFALKLNPIEGLSVAAGIAVPSIFGDSEESKADLNAGIDYKNDTFSAGATLRTPINNLGFGIFGSFTGVDGLSLNLGFSYNDDFAGVKGNLFTVGAAYEVSIFTVNFDFVSNLKEEGQDLYTALSLETGINDNFIAEAQVTLNMDYDDMNATETIAELGAAYVNGNHKVRGGIALSITDSVAVSFPVYYKYTFEK